MANSYPSSEFHGVDILTRFPETIKPGNCHFHTHNLVDQGFFPDNHFGLIHQRLLVGGLLSKYWETVIEEHVRTLKPGGWLEIMEYNFLKTAERAGPKLAIMCNGLITACDIRGLQGRINEVLEPMLESAGLVNIQIKEDEYPLDQDTQLSKLGWDNVSEAFVALKPIVSRALPELEDDENYTRFTEETKNEARERKSIMYLYRIFGQKPQSCLLE
ncbi:hypothetical protein BX666DRAFT_1878248 [Dichotomocladium elegans]|nr:hypothetical protein BX666DRAFT_1878248 [Dichotomocladium elegans]